MLEPRKTNALSSYAARFAAVARDDLAIREVPFQVQVNLRGEPSSKGFGNAVRSVAGCVLPAANRVSRGPERSVLWLGPDEWLVVSARGDGGDLVAEFLALMTGQLVSVLDISANRTIIELSGEGARDVLSMGCSLDFHPRALTADHCAQTLFANVQVILEQTDNLPIYRIYVRPSFARYLADWLLKSVE